MDKLFWLVLSLVLCNISANTQPGLEQELGYVPSLGDTSPGSVWPQPQSLTSTPQTYTVTVENFSFKYVASSHRCSTLDEAFKRYGMIMMSSTSRLRLKFRPKVQLKISSLEVNLLSTCQHYPSLNMNEAYTMEVGDYSLLTSESVWGILRGLETFSQLLWESETGEFVVNKTNVIDHPRYSHRGILLDTSRHFLPVRVLLENLDAMAYNKYNVFHWHIVDQQSFPYVSQAYPGLSKKGAYQANYVYTPDDVAAVVEYARLRGIRVVPEFDTPGHSLSWGLGQPGLLTPCYAGGKPTGTYGPINPTVESTYDFIRNLFTELKAVFPDKYLHLGGDEVSFNCWKSNPDITNYMKEKNITGDYAKLEEIYVQRVTEISKEVGFSYIVWQEVVDNGVKVKDDTVVEVWINNHIDKELEKVTKLGYRAILTAPWYLNMIHYREDWQYYYMYEPSAFNGTEKQKELVVGGEACMWGEYVDATNIIPRLWPRASAVAERLWSAKNINDVTKATPRLHQQRCRMLQRGINAEPLHPGYCVHERN
ncbi:beta-hexosaminidase subunit alpha-like [Clavelina lepadiformis]|uniref:Beta-hexosaminidase n=1 Tax=Clavelina lepadiformis TaxID=159417 RepID=A0ABP0GRP9_CLALP